METPEKIKQIVRDKYGRIAQDSQISIKTGCGCGCSETFDYTVMSDDYSKIDGYVPDADLGLGCGVPTEFAEIKEGDTVLDLGSGAGNDVFIARRIVGEKGKVVGLDMTDEMIQKARENCAQLGYNNVEFRFGEIEAMPVLDNSIDVVISNCVLNLVPDKKKAFDEIYRVMKPGGHFCISDIVLIGNIPEKLQSVAEIYTGCIAGAKQKEEYLQLINEAGFIESSIKKEKEITIPIDVLENFLNEKEIEEFYNSGTKILSITVTAAKKKIGCC
jgi:ubiquinone/menaquinone biosynthesis C-methylase UbiE